MSVINVESYALFNKSPVLSICSEIGIMSEYLDFYIANRIETVPPDCFDDIKKTISISCAFSAFMPDDAVFAFTVSLPVKKRKIFCSVDLPAKTFVARTHKWNPKEYDKYSRLAVQKTSSELNLNTVSMVDCNNESENSEIITRLFERYFDMQEDAYYEIMETTQKTAILKSNDKTIKSDIEFLSDKYDKNPESTILEMQKVDEFQFVFNCGCNSERMLQLFSTLPIDDLNYLFEKDDEISVECPRCGQLYKIKRDEIKKD